MKKLKKWMAFIVIFIALIIIGGISYVTLALPNVGDPENLKVELTPARIARGKYLANHVAVCMDCHSTRKWNEFAGPIDTAVLGAGGDVFDEKVGLPGFIVVPNITPFNLSKWTDGELYRAITTGVRKDGSALMPIMPYTSYGQMDREDVLSIIAYVRTLKPHASNTPPPRLNFPLNVIVHTLPKKAQPGKLPSPADTLAYGAYLVRTAACTDCHTKDTGKGADFAGGNEFTMPGAVPAVVRSANITPDAKTGIGAWTKQQFVTRFKQFDQAATHAVKPGDFQTVMPWYRYAGMKATDLEAMYAYLRTVKPVSNAVVKFERKLAGK